MILVGIFNEESITLVCMYFKEKMKANFERKFYIHISVGLGGFSIDMLQIGVLMLLGRLVKATCQLSLWTCPLAFKQVRGLSYMTGLAI